MKKNISLLLAFTMQVALFSNSIFTMENDLLADVDPQKMSTLSSLLQQSKEKIGQSITYFQVASQKTEQVVPQIEPEKQENNNQANVPSDNENVINELQDNDKLQNTALLALTLEAQTQILKDEETFKKLHNLETRIEDVENKAEQIENKIPTIFDISFNRKQLLCFGASAVAIITICGVTYILYKNGTLKKVYPEVKQFVKEYQVAVSSLVTAAVVLVIAGLYAKKQGVTCEHLYNRIMNLLAKEKSKQTTAS